MAIRRYLSKFTASTLGLTSQIEGAVRAKVRLVTRLLGQGICPLAMAGYSTQVPHCYGRNGAGKAQADLRQVGRVAQEVWAVSAVRSRGNLKATDPQYLIAGASASQRQSSQLSQTKPMLPL